MGTGIGDQRSDEEILFYRGKKKTRATRKFNIVMVGPLHRKQLVCDRQDLGTAWDRPWTGVSSLL